MFKLQFVRFAILFLIFSSSFTINKAEALECRKGIGAASEIGSENGADIEGIKNHLQEKGFQQLTQHLFRAEHVVIQIRADGKVRLFFERFYWPTGWMNAEKGWSVQTAEKGVLAILLSHDGALRIIESENADTPRSKEDLKTSAAKKPILEQLTDAGFVRFENTENIHSYERNPGDGKIAITHDGKLVHFYYEIDSFHFKALPEFFDVISVKKKVFDNKSHVEIYSEMMISDDKRLLVLSTCGSSSQGQTKRVEYLFDQSNAEIQQKLKIDLEEPKLEATTGFVLGGRNSTDLLNQLEILNGIRINKLEAAMRPGESSAAGFLGSKENLREILSEDNRFVVDELGLTHQELALPLLVAQEIWRKESQSGCELVVFPYHGRKFVVGGQAWRGSQESPFQDRTSTNVDLKVINMSTKKRIDYSGLIPTMMIRYGFYEGKETPYRINPKDIIDVFDFLNKRSP